MELSRILERSSRRTTRDRVARPTTPSKQTEVWYRDQLLGFVAELERITLEEMERVKLGDAELTVAQKINYSKMLDRIIERLQRLAVANFSINVASGMVGRANEQNKRTITSSMKEAFNIDVSGMLGSQVVRDTLELAVDENVNLIKSIQTDYINDIGDTIRKAVIEGRRHTDMVAEIRDRGGVSESRARLIARDQTAKINSDLTKERHQSLGIEMYVWGSAGDVRTRDSHKAMIGKVCKYDDPTVYSDDDGKTWKKRTTDMVKLNPGEDYQCRCTSRPFIKIE